MGVAGDDELVFVFGTLKRGFALHRRGLASATFLGAYRTRKPYPLLIAGRWFAPMMFNEPGIGRRVLGEVYSVDETCLRTLDQLESVGEPGNFRATIEVEAVGGGSCCLAAAYLKTRTLADPVHSDYLQVYDDRRFVPFEERQIGQKTMALPTGLYLFSYFNGLVWLIGQLPPIVLQKVFILVANRNYLFEC